MTTAQRITKYWTDTYCEDQFNLAKKQCVKLKDHKENYGYIFMKFEDNSYITFWIEGNTWEIA